MATRNDYLHCRMKPEDIAMLDRIVEHYNLGTRTATIGFLIKAEIRRIEAEQPTIPREEAGGNRLADDDVRWAASYDD